MSIDGAPRLRWGLIGLGRLAETELAGSFSRSERGRLVACAGRDAHTSRDFARRHGVAASFASGEELIASGTVDAVYVATSNPSHVPIVMSAAEHGVHVLCEKPLAPSVRDAEAVLACDQGGIRLQVGHHLRFYPIVTAIRDVVRDGRLGEVVEVSVQRIAPTAELTAWRRDAGLGRGILADVGTHLLDLLEWIVPSRIVCLAALARVDAKGSGTEDTAVVIARFGSGAVASVRCTRAVPKGANDLQICGSGAALATGPLRWTAEHTAQVTAPEGVTELRYPATDPYAAGIDAFADGLDGRPTPAALGHDGLRSAILDDAVRRSLETGTVVDV